MCSLNGGKSLLVSALLHQRPPRSFGGPRRPVYYDRRCFKGGSVLLIQVPSLASRSNNALVSDVCAAALRAFFNAPQRER